MQAIGVRLAGPGDRILRLFQMPRGEPKMRGKDGEHPLGDMGQLIFLGLFIVLWVDDSFFLRLSTFLSGFVCVYFRLVLAAPVLAIAAWLARSGHAAANPEGCTAGVISADAFGHVRHPLYLASILFYLCLAVATASLLSLALTVGIALFYDYIASYEEGVLQARYGDEYSKYKEKTGKWLPLVRRRARYAEQPFQSKWLPPGRCTFLRLLMQTEGFKAASISGYPHNSSRFELRTLPMRSYHPKRQLRRGRIAQSSPARAIGFY
jgi:protein-S-isoprenylcysteine O-methyltransferase Ste14